MRAGHLSAMVLGPYRAAPRGLPTIEYVGTAQVFPPDAPIPKHKRFSQRLAEAIAQQVLDGRVDLDELRAAAPNLDVSLFDSVPCDYGPRLRIQLPNVIAALSNDPDSRRAVAMIATPEDPVPPCILAIQFLIREGRLQTIAFMRSWDSSLGLPYDVYLFRRLGEHVAQALHIEPGNVIVLASSLHDYLDER